MPDTSNEVERPDISETARIAELEAELAKAKAEVSALRKGERTSAERTHHRLRNTASGILIALTVFVSALSLVAVWLSMTVLNTDQYVKTVAPLASDPQVQSDVSKRVTDRLFEQVDVTAAVRSALPPNAQGLAVPLTSQLRGFVESQMQAAMNTEAFTTIWTQANQLTQEQVSALLLNEGDSRVLTNTNGTISVDLHALITRVLAQLEQSGVTLFQNVPADKVQGNVELFQSDELARASTSAQRLHTARYLAPIALVAIVAAAIALATNRRRATAWLGVALIGGMLLVAGGLAAGRNIALDQAGKVNLSAEAATSMYDTVTRFLQRSNSVGFLLGALIVLAALFTGQGRTALALRRGIQRASTGCARWMAAQGWQPRTASMWVAGHLAALRSALVIGAVVVFLVWTSPTVVVVLWILAVLLLLLFATEVLRYVGSVPLSEKREPLLDLREGEENRSVI